MAKQFQPRGWLRNAHVQSVLSSGPLRRHRLQAARRQLQDRSEEHILTCGDDVRLHGLHTLSLHQPAHGLVVLLHGWEGSADSNYLVDLSDHLLNHGFDVFRLNFRDHGGSHELNPGIFHSCRLDEVIAAVAAIQQRFAPPRLALAGFSLGGNFALRIALQARRHALSLAHVLAVCPVIDPHEGLFGIESAPWFYEYYFMRKWRESLRRKQAAFADTPLFTEDDLHGDLRSLTTTLVRRHTQFASLEHYLDGYRIAPDALMSLDMPVSILAASDDPVVPVAAFKNLRRPACVELDISAHGGHCGFLADARLRSFVNDYAGARLQRWLAADQPPPSDNQSRGLR